MISFIVTPLLQWYAQSRRDLPWRRDVTPYGVWVSEVMLQQTRVSAVVQYYSRWMHALPDVAALAAASPTLVYKLWEGLGYYRRVSHMHEAARIIMERYDGRIPSTVAELRSLPGVGEYMAGAIASIAYGVPEPAVDGNVLRVLSRLTGDDTDILTPAARTRARELLRPVIPRDRASDFTQAMFELGALVCTPTSPDCADCPLREGCYAWSHDLVAVLPVRVPRGHHATRDVTVLVLHTPAGYVLTLPRAVGLLAGTYGLPYAEADLAAEDVPAACAEWGVRALSVRPLDAARHVFSHVTWRMRGYWVECDVDRLPDACLVATADEVRDRYAIPTAFAAYRGLLV